MDLDIGNFNLTADRHNVTVQERYEKEDCSTGLRFVSYHGTVQAALRKLLNPELKQSDVKSAQMLLDAIDSHEKKVEQLIASVDFNAYRVDLQEDLDFLD